MDKKIIFSLLINFSIKYNFCTYLLNINKIEDIDNFNNFIEKLSNEDKAKDKDLTKKIRTTIIDSYQKLEKANSKTLEIEQCPFAINVYDGTKKYVSVITERGNLIFGNFDEIPQEGVKNVKGKDYIVINGKKSNNTISIIIFKEIPENKKINKDGVLEDDV